jgi:DnaK suppressor protein
MSPTDVRKYREILEKKHAELQTAPGRPASELGLRSGDWIDQSSQESEIHVRLAMQQTDSKLLRAVESAIQRLDGGSFGICQECGNEIAAVRLEAVPWTRVCKACKEKQTQA